MPDPRTGYGSGADRIHSKTGHMGDISRANHSCVPTTLGMVRERCWLVELHDANYLLVFEKE